MNNKFNLIFLFSKQLIRPILNKIKEHHFKKINSIDNKYYLVRVGKFYINYKEKYLNQIFDSKLKISNFDNKKYLEIGINFYYSFLFYFIFGGLGLWQLITIYKNNLDKIQIKNEKLNNLDNKLNELLKTLD